MTRKIPLALEFASATDSATAIASGQRQIAAVQRGRAGFLDVDGKQQGDLLAMPLGPRRCEREKE